MKKQPKRRTKRDKPTYADLEQRIANLVGEIKAMEAEMNADKGRLRFLTTRHNALTEWANAARRLVFSFPGVTEE